MGFTRWDYSKPKNSALISATTIQKPFLDLEDILKRICKFMMKKKRSYRREVSKMHIFQFLTLRFNFCSISRLLHTKSRKMSIYSRYSSREQPGIRSLNSFKVTPKRKKTTVVTIKWYFCQVSNILVG